MEVIDELLKHGADINIRCDRDRTPLHMACQKRQLRSVCHVVHCLLLPCVQMHSFILDIILCL